MTSPLEGALAAKIGKAFSKSLFYDATVNRTVTAEGPNPWDPPSEVTTNYACKAIVDEYSAYYLANSLINAGDVKVIILASSLSTAPTTADTVTIRGKTYQIIKVETDPAMATWECQCRT